jgi:hypothetical protein
MLSVGQQPVFLVLHYSYRLDGVQLSGEMIKNKEKDGQISL